MNPEVLLRLVHDLTLRAIEAETEADRLRAALAHLQEPEPVTHEP